MTLVLDAAGSQLDVVYLLYGLVFILLGTAVLLLPKEGIPSRLLPTLWLLSAFGISHGAREWAALFTRHGGYRPRVEILEPLLLLVSYAFLLEFGRRLIRAGGSASTSRRWLVRAMSPAAYVLVPPALALGLAWDGVAGFSAACRYFVGFPGSLLTAVGLLLCVETEGKSVESGQVLLPFRSAALAFVVYGIVGGLVVEPGSLFPADVLNHDTFLAAIGVPVQVFRAGCAVLILVTMSTILRVYHAEVRHRLRSLLEQARSSLAEVGRLSTRNRLILEAAGQGIYGLDRNGNTTFVNRIAAEMLGWSPKELLGNPHHDLVHHTRADGAAYPKQACPIDAAINDGRVHRGDGELFWRKDGSSFEVDFTSTPVLEHGTIVGTVVSFRDVTQIRRAQRHLRQAALVLQHMPEGVAITDGRGRIRSVNPAFETSTGYAGGEVIGRNARLFRSTHHDEAFYRGILVSLRDTERWQGEIWIRRKDGTLFPVDLAVSEVAERGTRRLAGNSVWHPESRKATVAERMSISSTMSSIIPATRPPIAANKDTSASI